MTAQQPEPPRGLSSDRIESLREQHGWNELPRPDRPGPFRVFLRQFRGALVLILVAAAVIAFALGERIDALAIGLVLALNAVLGFVQEWRAETALDALRSMLSPTAVVVRDGRERQVPARELLPGDLVILATGATIPADMRLTESAGSSVDESVLTGESLPVAKSGGADGDAGHVFAGTALVEGRAQGVVTAIGGATEFGNIAHLAGGIAGKRTNLQRRLARLARQIGGSAVVIAGGVIAAGLAVGRPLLEMVMTGLSLAVAMVPEGLPVVVTITLALGASAMARKNALARKLQAVETLGAASVICTDKTGTLTENQMTASEVWTHDRTYVATGEGYDPTGHIETDGRAVLAKNDPVLAAILKTGLICNHATLHKDGPNWQMIGEPTEGALVTLAFKGWAEPVQRDDRLAEVPFSGERKRMSVLARDGETVRLFVKGAPETILERSAEIMTEAGPQVLDEELRVAIMRAHDCMAERGLRVLALALRDAGPGDTAEERLVFLGLVGMIDPPRREVKAALDLARASGIRVVMITGDGAITASAIAARVGLGAPDVIEGPQLDAMDDTALAARLTGNVLFARTRPEHKLRIVKALQAAGDIVAMTGDGVNDAPALKQADIGIAMGIRGTEVSKSAADLILLDDDFSTIINAVGEGRRQFENVRKFVRYLLSSNAGEVIAIVANLFLGGPLVFLATQILWMNLVTDGVTAVALGLEKEEPDLMKRPPRAADEPILGFDGIALIVVFGSYTAASSLWVFYSLLPMGTDLARTAAFTAMLVFEKVSVFAFRTFRQPVTGIGWFSNRLLIIAFTVSLCLQVAAVYWSPLQILLKTVPLGVGHWMTIGALALPLIVIPELVKAVIVGRRANRTSAAGRAELSVRGRKGRGY